MRQIVMQPFGSLQRRHCYSILIMSELSDVLYIHAPASISANGLYTTHVTAHEALPGRQSLPTLYETVAFRRRLSNDSLGSRNTHEVSHETIDELALQNSK